MERAKIIMEQDIKNITDDILRLKDLSNSKLAENLANLSNDFETTKTEILNLTYKLDTIEALYNKMLKEYQSRGNA